MVISHKKYETMIESMFQIRKEIPTLVELQASETNSCIYIYVIKSYMSSA